MLWANLELLKPMAQFVCYLELFSKVIDNLIVGLTFFTIISINSRMNYRLKRGKRDFGKTNL